MLLSPCCSRLYNPVSVSSIKLRLLIRTLVTRRLVLFTLLLLVSHFEPATASAHENWISVRSKHLLVIGNGTEKDIRLIAVRLEQFREVATQLLLRSAPESTVPTTVIVF